LRNAKPWWSEGRAQHPPPSEGSTLSFLLSHPDSHPANCCASFSRLRRDWWSEERGDRRKGTTAAQGRVTAPGRAQHPPPSEGSTLSFPLSLTPTATPPIAVLPALAAGETGGVRREVIGERAQLPPLSETVNSLLSTLPS